jgi:hypothetical protein
MAEPRLSHRSHLRFNSSHISSAFRRVVFNGLGIVEHDLRRWYAGDEAEHSRYCITRQIGHNAEPMEKSRAIGLEPCGTQSISGSAARNQRARRSAMQVWLAPLASAAHASRPALRGNQLRTHVDPVAHADCVERKYLSPLPEPLPDARRGRPQPISNPRRSGCGPL